MLAEAIAPIATNGRGARRNRGCFCRRMNPLPITIGVVVIVAEHRALGRSSAPSRFRCGFRLLRGRGGRWRCIGLRLCLLWERCRECWMRKLPSACDDAQRAQAEYKSPNPCLLYGDSLKLR
jgi:hypothetical protein